MVKSADYVRFSQMIYANGLTYSAIGSFSFNNYIQIHVRRMELDELVAVIYGKKELTRVATRANIVDDPTCVALHLASNTCIPICMQSVEDRQCFVDFMKQIKGNAPQQPHRRV